MIFTTPKPFTEAIQARQVKTILPTTASTRQLQTIKPQLLERSMFSARVNNAKILENFDQRLGRIIAPEGLAPGEYMSDAKFRVEMQEIVRATGYDPVAQGITPGSLRDLTSTARLDLINDTNVKMARGHGYWQQGQSTGILDAWPAQELFRGESREKERNWNARWIAAGGKLFGGRMIALKNAPIWTKISAFGLPYPPFDFRSGMDVRDISRDQAIELKVIDANTQIQPESRNFNEDLTASAPERQTALFTALLQTLGDTAKLVDGALHIAG